eukprot:CAMPEP_0172533504 /NCGR_PEP_ID=MMETSP1067-20121228/6184_1 /TAXON_ID=265564 ORGANISM="Thalassiosira punctigera, Strain Tpunct2005C2" /NCGR_SAMPLE_ID=MMETSP1067 /ASSEMBLY_ACC=CAM_ASM_000444 /LENGTH=404 /DNA_ID=CAMNT_0013318155 /DNA_START=68 /DNA_END=1282 /DNA_ORIENTATION=+
MAVITLVDIALAGVDPSRSTQFNLFSLPDPSNDDASTRDYMLVSSAHPRSSAPANETNKNPSRRQPHDIYEIQTVLPHSGKYASYFVGSRIVSNPALHVTTRVDPLFFALAHLQHAMTKSSGAEQLGKWQPWDQALRDMPSPVLSALDLDPTLNITGVDGVGQLGHLLDVSDMCGDDLILCKFSEERALKWLGSKFERAVEALRRRLREKKRSAAERSKELKSLPGGSGAFSSSFTVAEEDPTTAAPENFEKKDSSGEEKAIGSGLSKGEEQSLRVGALQLISDYLPTEWKGKLSKEVGITDEDWMGKKKSKSNADAEDEGTNVSGGKRSRSSWEAKAGQADADALLQYTVGSSSGSNEASVITPGGKKEVQNAQSVGLKRLAKVNKKGMKSLTCFFGASKKKK